MKSRMGGLSSMLGKNIIKSKLKKLSTVLLAVAMSISIAGCNGSTTLLTFAQTDLGQQIYYRFAENQAILDSLYQNELISETVYNSMSKSIDSQREKYLTKDESGVYQANIEINKDSGKLKSGDIVKAVSELRALGNNTIPSVIDSDGKEKVFKDSSEMSTYIVSNYLASDYALNLPDMNYNLWQPAYTNSDDIEPIKVIDSEALTFTDNLDCEIYVLKSDIFTADGTGGIDGVIELLGKDENIKNIKSLSEYFEPAVFSENVTDESGNVIHNKGEKITLRDLVDIEDLVGESKSFSGDSIPDGENGETGNRPGYDMYVRQYNYGVLKIKFNEFNLDAVNKFMVAMGIDGVSYESTGKWEILRNGGENRAYLMEYPVYYISGMESSDDNVYADLILEQSDLGVNLKSGKTVVYVRDSEGNVTLTRTVENSNENYLDLAGAVNERADSQSAYILAGKAEINLSLGDVDKGIKADTGRLVLRDYLEATYTPEFSPYTDENSNGETVSVAKENLVVFGRKIRFIDILKEVDDTGETNLKLHKSKNCAIFVNKDGQEIANSPRLNVTDFCDVEELQKGKVLRTTRTGEAVGSGEGVINNIAEQNSKIVNGETGETLHAERDSGTGNIVEYVLIRDEESGKDEYVVADKDNEEHKDRGKFIKYVGETSGEVVYKLMQGVVDTSVTAEDLAWESTNDTVTISTRFPGEIIGTKDNKRDSSGRFSAEFISTQHQVFYAVATTSDIFSTSLYSTWITSDDDGASLRWWNSWLSVNDYLYNIDKMVLENAIYNAYKYELTQNGIVILDLEIVAKIQEDMDKEAERESNQFIRTTFKLLGILLIVYSIVLFMCWLIDTNVDMGFKLVTKLTMGNTIPVKYSEDIPIHDSEDRKYIDLQGISIMCIVIIAVGILLIAIDIFDIVLFLIGALGELAKQISKVISGV